jgi:crotonobetainyl-CoA:carnitine CoA-transferase CaiB-like acyl-CoA transferase
MPNRISAWAIYDVFEFANGEQMFVAATGEGQWNALCQLLGQSALLDDPSLATNNDRVLQRPRLLAQLAEVFVTMDAQALALELETNSIPFAPIRRPEELFEDPHLLQSGGLANLELEDGSFTAMPLLPLSLDGERLHPRRSIPRIGEHTQKIMRELGYSDEHIAELCAAGVLKTDVQV